MAPRFFLAFFILTSSLVVGQSPKYALKGGKVSLKPDIAGQPDGILWKHKGNKVVEFNGNEEQVYSPFDKRITLGWVSAELQITDLRFEDSGEYELEVEVKKALHHRSFHKLEVIDTVAEPTISCKMNDGSSSNSSAELECSSESRRPQPLTKFEWSTRGNVQPGPKLRISLGDERDDEVYSCSVSNPLSSKTATFTAKDCYPDKSSSIALIASLLSIFLLLLVGVGVGIWCCKLHNKACFAKEDLEKLSSPDTTEDKMKARANINRALLERASTRLSNQPLRQFAPGHMDEEEEKPLKACDVDEEDEMPPDGHVKDEIKKYVDGHNLSGGQTPFKQWQTEVIPDVSDKLSEDAQSDPEFTIAPEPPAVDMDKQEEEPLKVRSPGNVKDEIKLIEDRLHHSGGQTSSKKWQTDEHKRTTSPPSLPPSESPCPLELNNPASNDDSDVPAGDVPAGVLDKLSEDAQSNPEFIIAPEQPGSDKAKAQGDVSRPLLDRESTLPSTQQLHQFDQDKKKARANINRALLERASIRPSNQRLRQFAPEPEKEADDEEKPATSETSPAVQPHSPATKSFPNMAPEDTGGEHKEDADSDQVAGGTAEENGRESDSSEKKVSDDSSEDELSSTIPEQKGSKTSLHDKNLSQEEANTNKDNQQETVKPVSEDDEIDKESDLYLADSQQPKSPTPTKPDNGNADTPQELPDAAHPGPDNREEEEEPKTSRDSDESDGQSDKGEGETDEGKNDIQRGLKEEKPGNESLSEDKEGQKEDEVVK